MDMDVRPLATEADYDWALGEVGAYFDRQPAPGTPIMFASGTFASVRKTSLNVSRPFI